VLGRGFWLFAGIRGSEFVTFGTNGSRLRGSFPHVSPNDFIVAGTVVAFPGARSSECRDLARETPFAR